MGNIILIADAAEPAVTLSRWLRLAGEQVWWCAGGPTPFVACPLMRAGECIRPEAADLIVFAYGIGQPVVAHRTYRPVHVLRAYRAHPRYGSLPMLIVGRGAPADLGGGGPLAGIDHLVPPAMQFEAIRAFLEHVRRPTVIDLAGEPVLAADADV